jgi:hypothetical protein
MITVRFPSGFSIQYNDAAYAKGRSSGAFDLLVKEGGKWIATVPADCVIEAVAPCRMYNANSGNPDTAAEIAALRKEVRKLSRELAKWVKA